MKFMNKDNVTTLCDELSKNHSQGSEGGAIEDGSVTTDKLSNGAVSEEKLSSTVREKLNNDNDTTYALSKSGSTITLTGSDGSTTSVTDSSGTSGISDGEVTTTKLADGAVTTDKLANQSVTTAKIADDAITYSELAPSAVRTAILQDSAVTNAKINNGAVSEEKLASAVQTKLNRTYSVVDGSNDGLMSSDMYRKLNTLETPMVDILNLNNTNFTGHIDCVKTGGICSIITRDDCESNVSFNPNTWYDIGQLASGFRPTRGFYTPVTLGQFTGRVWCDSLGNLKILISADSSVTTIPSTLRLAFNAVFSHE